MDNVTPINKITGKERFIEQAVAVIVAGIAGLIAERFARDGVSRLFEQIRSNKTPS